MNPTSGNWRTARPGDVQDGEPRFKKWLSRLGITAGLLIAGGILWARSQGWLP